MIVRIDDEVRRGRVVTVETAVDPWRVACAVREGAATDRGTEIAVQAHSPSQVHERVGCLHPEMGLRVRTALAEAARSRGYRTAVDGEIRQLRERLAAMDVESVETSAERAAVAEQSTATERLQERTAELRGELSAHRESDGDEADKTAAQFREAARELSEAETSAAAARQRLSRRRQEAQSARDRLQERMALEDDLANRRREARRRLVERLREPYERAIETVPGGPENPDEPFEVDALTAALAVARLAKLSAPVVLACDRFESPAAASAWLDAPVLRAQI